MYVYHGIMCYLLSRNEQLVFDLIHNEFNYIIYLKPLSVPLYIVII